MFWFKIWFLKKILNRSVSFFGQETHEHVKTIKNVVWMPKTVFFRKCIKQSMFSRKGFPPCSDFWFNFALSGPQIEF